VAVTRDCEDLDVGAWAVWSVLEEPGGARAVLTFDETDAVDGGMPVSADAVLGVVGGWVAPSGVRALLFVDDAGRVSRARGRHRSDGGRPWVGDVLGCMLGEPPARPEVVPRFLATVTAATFVNAAADGARTLAELARADPVVPLAREVLGRDGVAALRSAGGWVLPGDWMPGVVVLALNERVTPEVLVAAIPQDSTLPVSWLGASLAIERCMARMPTLEASLATLTTWDVRLGARVRRLLLARGWLPAP
jgi:hypothetical protein